MHGSKARTAGEPSYGVRAAALELRLPSAVLDPTTDNKRPQCEAFGRKPVRPGAALQCARNGNSCADRLYTIIHISDRRGTAMEGPLWLKCRPRCPGAATSQWVEEGMFEGPWFFWLLMGLFWGALAASILGQERRDAKKWGRDRDA